MALAGIRLKIDEFKIGLPISDDLVAAFRLGGAVLREFWVMASTIHGGTKCGIHDT